MKRTHLASLLIASATISVALADDVYKVIDENGTVVYSDRPINGLNEEVLEINTGRSAQRSGAANQTWQQNAPETEGQKDQAALAAAVQTREAHEAENAARQIAMQEKRAAQCEQAQQRAEKYNTHQRLYTIGSDGEREYLSDDELDAARAEAARTAEELCS